MTRFAVTFVFFILMHYYCQSQEKDMVSVANHLISILDKDQKLKAVYPFETEERFNFHFVPKNDRKGISLNELNAAQKSAALLLLKACVSERGYQKANEIIQLETTLKAIEGRQPGDNYRDPGKYFFTIFGIPGSNTIWGWRLEGHHVAFNFSAQKGKLVASTPNFLGSNPAIVPEGPQKGKQILKDESDMGFDILHSFTKEQLQQAVISDKAPGEIFTSNNRTAMIENTQGIGYAEMNKQQQEKLLRLVNIYIHRYTKTFADNMLKEIQAAGLDKVHFAWLGAQQQGPGNAHYYRIHGPGFIIEYDNVQNNANHVHTVVRDLKHDFGGDVLLEHYKNSH